MALSGYTLRLLFRPPAGHVPCGAERLLPVTFACRRRDRAMPAAARCRRRSFSCAARCADAEEAAQRRRRADASRQPPPPQPGGARGGVRRRYGGSGITIQQVVWCAAVASHDINAALPRLQCKWGRSVRMPNRWQSTVLKRHT